MKLSEKRTLKKKEQILLTAITVINQRGYGGATMEEIAAELLMTKGSLYYYFKNKGDLMYQCHNFVLSQAANELEDVLEGEGTAEKILRSMIATHIDYVIDEKETNNLIIEPRSFFNDYQLEAVLKLRKYYSSLFDQAIEKGRYFRRVLCGRSIYRKNDGSRIHELDSTVVSSRWQNDKR